MKAYVHILVHLVLWLACHNCPLSNHTRNEIDEIAAIAHENRLNRLPPSQARSHQNCETPLHCAHRDRAQATARSQPELLD